MAAVHTAKKDLRQLIKRTLSEVTTDSISVQSQNATNVLFSIPEYAAAKRISIYLSMPTGEISTTAIVENALGEGKKVFIPYIHKSQPPPATTQPKSVMDMLSLHSKADLEDLARDAWGIPTLSKESISSRENCLGSTGRDEMEKVGIEEGEGGLDLIVMPGMAFDTELRRLGHGRGYYDFFLQRYVNSRKGRRMPLLVGLALNEQVLPQGESIPTDTTDWPLDRLIVGDGRLLSTNIRRVS